MSMSVNEANVAVKESVLSALFEDGLNAVETVQVDSYKWVIPVEVEGEQRFAEIALTAKKADFTYEDANAAKAKFIEKYEKAMKREADKTKKATKENSKTPRNSSGNLDSSSVVNGVYVPYTERYANNDF